VPFAANTFTSYWEGQAHAVNWIGDLNIDSFRNASLANGYRGTINIAEIPD